jgi:hypothetical protein
MAKNVQANIVYQGGMKFEGKSGRAGTTVAVDFTPEGELIEGFSPAEWELLRLDHSGLVGVPTGRADRAADSAFH